MFNRKIQNLIQKEIGRRMGELDLNQEISIRIKVLLFKQAISNPISMKMILMTEPINSKNSFKEETDHYKDNKDSDQTPSAHQPSIL